MGLIKELLKTLLCFLIPHKLRFEIGNKKRLFATILIHKLHRQKQDNKTKRN